MAPSSSKRFILLISAGGSFLAPFMVSSLIVAIPSIGAEFFMNAASLSWLAMIFFLAASIFLIPFGRMADIFGVKKVFTIGICIYFFSALIAALSPSASVLIAARFLTGIGAAMIFGTSFALLSLSLSERERGGALGINIAANMTGFALGFFLGGLFTYYLSWRLIFVFTLPIAAIVIALIRLKLPGECAYSRGQSFDILGSAMIAGLLFMIIFGLSELPKLVGSASMIGGILLYILFVLWGKRNGSPVIDPRLFLKNKCFAFSNAAIMIYTASTLAVIFLFSLYLQYIRGYDARPAGLMLLVPTLVMAALVTYGGRLSDRVSPYKLASAGVLLSLAGLLMMSFISASTPLFLTLAELILVLAGGAFFSPPMVKIILASISREKYGVGSSLAETMRLIGNAVSMAIVTVGFTLHLGGTDITPAVYPAFLESMRQILACFVVLCAATLALIFFAERTKPKR